MSHRDRDDGSAYWGLMGVSLFLILAAFFSAWIIATYQAQEFIDSRKAAEEAAYYRDHELLQRCRTGTPEEIFNCLREQIGKSSEAYRAEYDLRAQQNMAIAAWVMIGTSIFLGLLTFGVSIYAAVLLKKTLDQTRVGTDAAVKAAGAASQELALGSRPWISITAIELRSPVRIEADNLRGHISLRIRVKNTGSTPAQLVWPFAKCYDAGIGGYTTHEGIKSLLLDAHRADAMRLGFTVFPDQENWCWLEIVADPREFNGGKFARPKVPHIVGFINYYTTYDKTPHQTGFEFNIVYRRGKVAVIPNTGDEFSASDFSIGKSAVGQFAT